MLGGRLNNRCWRTRRPGLAAVLLATFLSMLPACQYGASLREGSRNGLSNGLEPPPNFTRGLIVTNSPAPLYPQRARALGLEGWVMLSFSVDVDGNVVPGTIETVNAQPPGYFESSALNAVRRMNFENTVNRLVEDVRYVFRYELEERSGMFVAPVEQQAQFRELIPMRFITPDYPRFAEEQGLEGYVVVSFTVTETGTVSDISVVASEPAGVFDEQALIAARRLRFEPRLVEDSPVRAEGVTFRFDWRLP
jgi:TonB family protein